MTIEPVKQVVACRSDEALQIGQCRAVQATQKTFKVGDTELCEPDYRQICRWAAELGWMPEGVLDVLTELRYEYSEGHALNLRIENGAIKDLVWDGERLPIKAFEWEAGLDLEALTIINRMPTWTASQKLPSLKTLRAFRLGLTELDLSPVPGLTILDCYENQLTALDLSPVPGLAKLLCSENQLTKLDLTPVPELNELCCSDNRLSGLDLTPVPGLTALLCSKNQLTELDLTPVPRLIDLWCYKNQLTQLDLTPVPGIISLWCAENHLTELDLTPVPRLIDLWCSENHLTELNLRPIDDQNFRVWCDEGVCIVN